MSLDKFIAHTHVDSTCEVVQRIAAGPESFLSADLLKHLKEFLVLIGHSLSVLRNVSSLALEIPLVHHAGKWLKKLICCSKVLVLRGFSAVEELANALLVVPEAVQDRWVGTRVD